MKVHEILTVSLMQTLLISLFDQVELVKQLFYHSLSSIQLSALFFVQKLTIHTSVGCLAPDFAGKTFPDMAEQDQAPYEIGAVVQFQCLDGESIVRILYRLSFSVLYPNFDCNMLNPLEKAAIVIFDQTMRPKRCIFV